MAIYYLHICNGIGFVEDVEGRDVADLEGACKEAVDGLRDILAGELRSGGLNTASFIEIEDEHHDLVATISFDDVVQITREVPERARR